MIVVVIMGILVLIGIPAFFNMQGRAKVAQVKSSMHTVQIAVEDFATRNDGIYPNDATATTIDGALTLAQLLPSGAMPLNPFTAAPTTLDWSNVVNTAPATDAAGGIALNVTQSAGNWDTYQILGEDDTALLLTLILSNN